MDIRLSTVPVPAGAQGVVLVCPDCARPTAHAQYPNEPAACMMCGARQVPCGGNCGLWVPLAYDDAPDVVRFCGQYCECETWR